MSGGPQEVSDVNLSSRKKLIAVLTNPEFQVRALTVAICLLAAAVFCARRMIGCGRLKLVLDDSTQTFLSSPVDGPFQMKKRQQ